MEILGGGSVPERDKRDAKMAGQGFLLNSPLAEAGSTIGKPGTGDCMFSLAGWKRLSSWGKSFSNRRKGYHHSWD